MKNYKMGLMSFLKRISILSFILIFISSCDKEFLKKTDPTRVETDLFYQNTEQLNRALIGVYGQLRNNANNDWVLAELPADNSTVDLNPNDRGQASDIEQFEFWTYGAGTPHVNQIYNLYYSAISNINFALSKIGDALGDQEEKDRIEGQLKFLRGYLYFNLTQYYGDLVLITKPLDNPNDAFSLARIPQSEIFTQIETDLKDASNLLPDSYSSKDEGRATKGAALSMLGEVYLVEKKFGDAVTVLEPVLNLGYDLLPSYADVFDPAHKNSIESVFEIQYQGGNDLGLWSSFTYTFSPRLSKDFITGWPQSNPSGFNVPTRDIISQFEAGDERKDVSVGLDFVSPETGEVVPYIKKFNHPHAIYGRTDDDWPVIRFSKVLLSLAEAINESNGGPNAEAYSCINRVRNRAGLSSVSDLDQKGFREAVYHERRIELAFENDRWFFLKRTMSTDELVSFLNDYGQSERADPSVNRKGISFSSGDYKFDAHRIIYPIPDAERKTNPDLVQNPQY